MKETTWETSHNIIDVLRQDTGLEASEMKTLDNHHSSSRPLELNKQVEIVASLSVAYITAFQEGWAWQCVGVGPVSSIP